MCSGWVICCSYCNHKLYIYHVEVFFFGGDTSLKETCFVMLKYLPCGFLFNGDLAVGDFFTVSISFNRTLIPSNTFFAMTRLMARFQFCRMSDSLEWLDRLFANNELNARFTCSLCSCASGLREVSEWMSVSDGRREWRSQSVSQSVGEVGCRAC